VKHLGFFAFYAAADMDKQGTSYKIKKIPSFRYLFSLLLQI